MAKAAAIRKLPVTSPIEVITEEMARNGAVIIEDFLPAVTVAKINREIEGHLARQKLERDFMNPLVAGFFGNRTRHLTGVAAKSPTFVSDVLCHETYLGVGEHFLKPACAAFQLNLAHVFERGPGATAQLMHRDDLIWPALQALPGEKMFASLVALGDFTAEMGATLVVPGSHRWDRGRAATPDEIVPAAMEPGSAVIYLGSVIHAAGDNVTPDRWRRGMHVSYCLGWLRTEENQYLATPLSQIREMPKTAQSLLGFAAHDGIMQGGGYLGAVDLRDPADLLARGEL